MKIELSRTDAGQPKIAWIQRTHETGETRWKRNHKWVIGIGFALGFWFGCSGDKPALMLVGPIAGAVILGWVYTLTPHDKRSWRSNHPVLVNQYCEACLIHRNDTLFFKWWTKGRRHSDAFELPFAEVSNLVLGSHNEWHATRGDGRKYLDSMTIVMPLEDGRVFTLADHVGSQAELSRLHTVLTRHFIEPRDRLLRALEAERQADQLAASSDAGAPEQL